MQDTDMETGHLLVVNSPQPILLIYRQELLPIRRYVEFLQSREFAIVLLWFKTQSELHFCSGLQRSSIEVEPYRPSSFRHWPWEMGNGLRLQLSAEKRIGERTPNGHGRKDEEPEENEHPDKTDGTGCDKWQATFHCVKRATRISWFERAKWVNPST